MIAGEKNRKARVTLRSGVAGATVFSLALCLSQATFAQTSRSGPLDIRPRAQQQPFAPPDIRNPAAAPAPAQRPPSEAEDNGPLAARPGVLIPGMRLVVSRLPRYDGRTRMRLSSRVLARQVFRANEVNGKGSGFFLRTPDGRLHLLAVTPEKMRRIYFKTEVQRLAIPLRQRQRIAARRAARDAGYRDYRARHGGLGTTARVRRLSEFFSDTSLKAGDVVVTDQGLQVFRGGEAFPYTARQFMPLAQWRKANGRERRLEQIERELKRQP